MVLVDPMNEDMTIHIHNHNELYRPTVLLILRLRGESLRVLRSFLEIFAEEQIRNRCFVRKPTSTVYLRVLLRFSAPVLPTQKY